MVVGLLRIHGAPGVPGLRWLLGVGNQTKVVNAVHTAGEGVAKGGQRATGTGHGAPPPLRLCCMSAVGGGNDDTGCGSYTLLERLI